MWLDQVSLSSMKTPRYLTQVVRVMVLSLMFTLKSVSWLFLRLTIMYEVFELMRSSSGCSSYPTLAIGKASA